MINTKKIFDKTIQEIAKVVKLINEDGEDVDSKIISDMNDDISDLHATLFDGSNDFVELKDLKNYIKDVVGKDYFSDKRCWEYLYDSVYEVFIDIPNEFDESMQTGLGMAQQLPTNVTYDGELDDLYNFDDEEEKKKMNKRLEEKFDPPKDWYFNEMIEDYGFEYLSEKDPDSEPYFMDEFNELTSYADDPLEAITRAFYGGRYGFKNDSFNPNDEYFAYNRVGNLISIKDYDINDYLKENIDEEEFFDWCVEQGYFESDEDDE